jgi:predicted RNA-binding Zn-ribbon protein involved in translation (DUF1610 family)
MNLYHVKFWMTIAVNEEGEVVDDMDNEEETTKQDVAGEFDLGSMNLANAFSQAIDYLNKSIGEGDYEITGVEEREDVLLLNWPGGDECQCATCRTERAAAEDIIDFNCSCGYPIHIVTDFDKYECPNCHKLILRDRVIGSGTNYILMDIDKENE